MLSDFLHGMIAPTYRWPVRFGKTRVTHRHLSDAVQELNKELASSQCLRVAILHDVVFMVFDEKTVLILFCTVTAFICCKIAVLNAWLFYQSAFSLLNQVSKE